jgi:hypothetical protein
MCKNHPVNNKRKNLLSLVMLPARLNRTQAADYLGCDPDHITLLSKAGLIKPLGGPKPNSDKYFQPGKVTTREHVLREWEIVQTAKDEFLRKRWWAMRDSNPIETFRMHSSKQHKHRANIRPNAPSMTLAKSVFATFLRNFTVRNCQEFQEGFGLRGFDYTHAGYETELGNGEQGASF